MTPPVRKFMHSLIVLAFASALAFVVPGCGDDDDDPAGPDNPDPTTDFDQSMAVAQAQTAAPQAVALVQSMTALAAGVSKDAEKDYAWNPETERWEYDYVWAVEGSTYDWFYTVQYLNGDGDPQQSPAGAVTVIHNLNGTGDYHYEGEGTVLDYDYVYHYATSITGMGSGALALTGEGGHDIDYTYSSPYGNTESSYEVSWETLGDGISVSEGGGCPEGSIRYDFPPYYSLVVFNGTGTATSTLYDGNGNVVAGGGGTHAMPCVTR